MTLYTQKFDNLLAIRDRRERHRVAIGLCDLVGSLSCQLDRARSARKRNDLQLALAQLDDVASELCAAWYDVDYNDPITYDTNEYDTDRLLRLTSTGATVN
jgi:hypothetical protein